MDLLSDNLIFSIFDLSSLNLFNIWLSNILSDLIKLSLLFLFSNETNFSEDFRTTKAYRWMQKNAARYHFKLSFPEGNPQGVSFEPWLWRFEGTTNSLKLFESAYKKNKTF